MEIKEMEDSDQFSKPSIDVSEIKLKKKSKKIKTLEGNIKKNLKNQKSKCTLTIYPLKHPQVLTKEKILKKKKEKIQNSKNIKRSDRDQYTPMIVDSCDLPSTSINELLKIESENTKEESMNLDESIVCQFMNSTINQSEDEVIVADIPEKCSQILEPSDSQEEESVWEDISEVEFISIHRHYERLMKLEVGQSIHFKGVVNLKVIHGKIEVLGTHFSKESPALPIYSNGGSSLLSFEAIDGAHCSAEEIREMIHRLFAHCDPHKKKSNINVLCDRLISEDYTKFAFALVSKHTDNLTNFLYAHLETPIFTPKEVTLDKRRPFYETERMLSCLFETNNSLLFKTYKKHQDWDAIASSLMEKIKQGEHLRTMLCGGKGVGKSTLLRFLINRMLTVSEAVVCIDLDPGQAEFTVPGCVSVSLIKKPLLGSNFTHLKSPELCLFLGEIDVVQCISKYVMSLNKLADFFFSGPFSTRPCIINTMGFNKGMGVKLIHTSIEKMKPTHLIEIKSMLPQKNYQDSLTDDWYNNFIFPLKNKPRQRIHLNYIYHEISSKSELNMRSLNAWGLPPKDLRQLTILSYLSSLAPESHSIWDNTPYCAPLRQMTLCVAHEKPNLSEYLSVFNANIVGLCHIDCEKEWLSLPEDPQWHSIANRVPLSHCYGFGIVRGVDMKSACIYVVMPPDVALNLSHINCLVLSTVALPMPLSLLTMAPSNFDYSLPILYVQKREVKGQGPLKPTKNKFFLNKSNIKKSPSAPFL